MLYTIELNRWDNVWVACKKSYATREEAMKRAYEIINLYNPETIFDVRVINNKKVNTNN
jgi:hypothetical protein